MNDSGPEFQTGPVSSAATGSLDGCCPTRSSPPTSPPRSAAAEEMDRVYAMNLAMIRKAAQMTQVEVARKLGVGQGVVSRLEHRDDMLLSTLYDYLMATGADGAGIVVTVHGQRIELDLARLRSHPQQQTA